MSCSRQQGFTLLEILLVISMMALTSVMVLPSLFQMAGASAHDEGRRFQQALRLVSEEAQVESTAMRVVIYTNHYAFERMNADSEWELLLKPPFMTYHFPDSVKVLQLNVVDVDVMRVKDDELKQDKTYLGQVVFLPSGDITLSDLIFEDTQHEGLHISIRPGPGGITTVVVSTGYDDG